MKKNALVYLGLYFALAVGFSLLGKSGLAATGLDYVDYMSFGFLVGLGIVIGSHLYRDFNPRTLHQPLLWLLIWTFLIYITGRVWFAGTSLAFFDVMGAGLVIGGSILIAASTKE